jgi:hypothetical protein
MLLVSKLLYIVYVMPGPSVRLMKALTYVRLVSKAGDHLQRLRS